MINRWEIEREDTLTAKVQKLNQKVHCRARGRHVACSSRAIATRRRRHTVKKLFRSAADTVDLSVPQAQGMRSMAKEVSAITREPREVCRTGHCAQPSIYQLATTFDPTTAAGGAAAAAAGAAGPGSAGGGPAPQLRRGKTSKVHCTGLKLSLAITSRRQQPESQPQPWARGLLGTRDIVCDIGKLKDPIS